MPIRWITEKKRWRFEFVRVINGERHRASRLLPAGWSRAQADAFDRKEAARLYALASGIERDRPLIAQAVKLYLDHVIPGQKDGKKAAQTLALLLPYYESEYLDRLPEVCDRYAREADVSAATARNRLAYLRAACRYAFKHHRLGEHDPAERVILPQPAKPRTNYPKRRDLVRAMRACRHRDARAVMALAFYTGMRWRSEILRATLVDGVLIVGYTKGDRPHAVPVHPKAMPYARRLPVKLNSRSIYAYYKEAIKAIGASHLTLHDQRHGTASALINEGATLAEVGAFLGHTSPQATARYAHLVMATKRKMLAKLA